MENIPEGRLKMKVLVSWLTSRAVAVDENCMSLYLLKEDTDWVPVESRGLHLSMLFDEDGVEALEIDEAHPFPLLQERLRQNDKAADLITLVTLAVDPQLTLDYRQNLVTIVMEELVDEKVVRGALELLGSHLRNKRIDRQTADLSVLPQTGPLKEIAGVLIV
jgi:hypothetical protein